MFIGIVDNIFVFGSTHNLQLNMHIIKIVPLTFLAVGLATGSESNRVLQTTGGCFEFGCKIYTKEGYGCAHEAAVGMESRWGPIDGFGTGGLDGNVAATVRYKTKDVPGSATGSCGKDSNVRFTCQKGPMTDCPKPQPAPAPAALAPNPAAPRTPPQGPPPNKGGHR